MGIEIVVVTDLVIELVTGTASAEIEIVAEIALALEIDAIGTEIGADETTVTGETGETDEIKAAAATGTAEIAEDGARTKVEAEARAEARAGVKVKVREKATRTKAKAE